MEPRPTTDRWWFAAIAVGFALLAFFLGRESSLRLAESAAAVAAECIAATSRAELALESCVGNPPCDAWYYAAVAEDLAYTNARLAEGCRAMTYFRELLVVPVVPLGPPGSPRSAVRPGDAADDREARVRAGAL